MRPCMEYFCHNWAGAPSCYLEIVGYVHTKTHEYFLENICGRV